MHELISKIQELPKAYDIIEIARRLGRDIVDLNLDEGSFSLACDLAREHAKDIARQKELVNQRKFEFYEKC